MNQALTPRELLWKQWNALKTERQSSWDPHVREVLEYFAPRRARYLQSDVNKGAKKNGKILNSTTLKAAGVLQSGMQAGITSPARPWFRFVTPDPKLSEFWRVRDWLHICEERTREVFARSNFYLGQHKLYGDISTAGTGVLYMEDDAEDVLRVYDLPPGSYSLAVSDRCAVNTVFRETTLTVANYLRRFGIKLASRRVHDLYMRGDLQERVGVVHCVEPNEDFTLGNLDRSGMPWKSVWFDAELDDPKQPFLRESGYREFPFLAVRWDATGEDVYGRGPGMDTLPDAKELQEWTRRKKSLGDKATNPSMVGPPSLRNSRATTMAGDLTIVADPSGTGGYRPAFEIRADQILAAREQEADCERRVKEGFYADLWLQMIEAERGRMTATEVQARSEERMIQLGPTLERLNDEDLDPAIDRTFAMMLRRGMVPPPPPELRGMELRVEYISIMAEAQKLLGTSAVERLAAFTGNLAATSMEVLDKFDSDAALEVYARMLGTDPRLIRSEDKVLAIRSKRDEAAQQQASMQQAGQVAQGAATLAQADMQGDTALNRLMGNIGGVAGASASGGALQ